MIVLGPVTAQAGHPSSRHHLRLQQGTTNRARDRLVRLCPNQHVQRRADARADQDLDRDQVCRALGGPDVPPHARRSPHRRGGRCEWRAHDQHQVLRLRREGPRRRG